MKNLKLTIIKALIFVFPVTLSLGSSGSSADGAISISDNGVVKCKIDGVDWISGPPGHPEMQFEEEAITDGRTLVQIEAFAANGSYLAIAVYRASGIGPGTYPITEMGMRGFFKDDFNTGGGYLTNGMKDNPGSITITAMTADKVAGTFAFALRNSGDPDDIRQVTEGSFEVRFTK